ncbi:MAG: hypothetical protein MJ223_02570 [Mycoplasmoidaceae bacterium]|nr:hypothetical protein [Mycoplasmoidaceae bacterium]
MGEKKIIKWLALLAFVFIPFGGYLAYSINKTITQKANKLGIKTKPLTVLVVITSAIGLNCISNSIIQSKINLVVSKEVKHV